MAIDTTNRMVRILGPVALASGTSTAFTGTTGHDYTIRQIRIVNTDTVNAITVKLGIGGVAAANLILPPVSIDAGGWAEFDGIIIMSGTETLQANTTATGLTLTAAGLDQS